MCKGSRGVARNPIWSECSPRYCLPGAQSWQCRRSLGPKRLLSGLLPRRSGLRRHHRPQVAITFGIRAIGDGTDGATSGFLATTFIIRTIMQTGFLATGFSATVGGTGLRDTGGISVTPRLAHASCDVVLHIGLVLIQKNIRRFAGSLAL
jgi:hypothetical protein